MKKVLCVSLLLAIIFAGLTWAQPGAEAGPPAERVTLTILGQISPEQEMRVAAVKEQVKPTDLTVRWMTVALADGTAISMDILVAAGAYPNVYADFTGRASRFMVRTKGWKAMDLFPYVNRADYIDLGPWTKDGKLLGLPHVIPAQGIVLNLDLLDAAGYKPPDPKDWTVDAFLAMCKAVKTLPGKYGTALFAKNASADYLWFNWFGSFGAQMFTGGNYKQTSLNSPQGIATLRFLQGLVQQGYSPATSAELWDDAALELWQRGLVAAMPIRPDWVSSYLKGAVDQKMIAKSFRWVMYPFPRGPGVAAVPTIGAGLTAVVGETGNATMDRMAAYLVESLTGREAQEWTLTHTIGSFATLKGIKGVPPKETSAEDLAAWKVVSDIVQTVGMLDVGYALPEYQAIRAEMPLQLVKLYNGLITPEAAMAAFEKNVNDILAGK